MHIFQRWSTVVRRRVAESKTESKTSENPGAGWTKRKRIPDYQRYHA